MPTIEESELAALRKAAAERDVLWRALYRLGSVTVEVKAGNTPDFMAYFREEIEAARLAMEQAGATLKD